ncbi:mitochondrial import inner membrane translocase subunit tim21 [Coemansia sp. RSA 2599]|nr:mitochondrial import inner membrane translocase subunit tim21 [Coemansia sp. RSA 2599]
MISVSNLTVSKQQCRRLLLVCAGRRPSTTSRAAGQAANRSPSILVYRRGLSTSSFGAGSSGRGARIAGTAGNVLVIGSVMTLFGYIMYTLYDNLFAENGVTRVYNQSLDLVRANPQIKELFGPSVSGFGEPSHSQRQRHRAIAHRTFEDPKGRERLTMQYYIKDSQKGSPYVGVVKVDLAKSAFTGEWGYNYVVVDLYRPDSGAEQGGAFREEHLGNAGAVSRIEVLVTDEFAKEVRAFEHKRRNQKFSVGNKGSSDGSWFSVLNPTNWRK